MNVPDVCVALPRILPNNHSFIGTGYRKGMKQIKLSASSASSESVYLEAGTKRSKLNLLERIDYFSSFKENWNGYGAISLPDSVIRKAKDLVEHLPEKAKVFPTAQSSIQFELDYLPGKYLEIEVLPDAYAVLFESDSTHEDKDHVSHEAILEHIKAYDAH
jgi:hypothetical protein